VIRYGREEPKRRQPTPPLEREKTTSLIESLDHNCVAFYEPHSFQCPTPFGSPPDFPADPATVWAYDGRLGSIFYYWSFPDRSTYVLFSINLLVFSEDFSSFPSHSNTIPLRKETLEEIG